MRAEGFYNFATYIEEVSDLLAYVGKSLHQQSHGESFISVFANRFEHGIYILDEPEAALSPQRQLSFLQIIHDLDRDVIREVSYRDTKHFLIARDFLNSPERCFKHLFGPADNGRGDV